MPCCCSPTVAQPCTSALPAQPVHFNYPKRGVEKTKIACSYSKCFTTACATNLQVSHMSCGARKKFITGFHLILLAAIFASTTLSTINCLPGEEAHSTNIFYLNDVCGEEAVVVGNCAQGLQCVLRKEDHLRRCTEMDKQNCLKAKCKVMFPSCPLDSRPIIRLPALGECCAKPAICQCDPQKCDKYVPICKSGLERVLVSSASNRPGACCDRFECRQPELHCENVKCPDSSETYDLYSKDGKSCPADSFRPAAYVPQGSCCPIISECRCQSAICAPVRCSSTQVVVIEKKGSGRPGNCCDHFSCKSVRRITGSNKTDSDEPKATVVSITTYCIHEGKKFMEGTEWHQDNCEICTCNGGVALCKKMECPTISHHCNWVGIPDGECCPVCLGCKDLLTNRQIGEFWTKDDCTNCTCGEDFRWHCQKFICKTDCDSPKKMEGECCPICDEPLVVDTPVICASLELCPLRCEFGLFKNQWGCFECKCAAGSEKGHPLLDTDSRLACSVLTAENCDKQCAHGYLRDITACPMCKCAKCPPIDSCYKHCLYGFKTNSLGCSVCKCRAKHLFNARFLIQKESVENGDVNCFSTSDLGKLVERDNGEWWTDNHCRQCFCQNKKEYCSLISCPNRPSNCPEEKWIVRKGGCCPSCSLTQVSHPKASGQLENGLLVCHSPGDGRLFVDGETWQLNECIACTCRMGHVLCSATDCNPVACEQPALHSCCANCSESSAGLSSELLNLRPGSLEHSNICTDQLGNTRQPNSHWKLDECTSCYCDTNNLVKCFRQLCAETSFKCKNSLMIKGRCCPICSDDLSSGAVCMHDSNIYGLNEEFRDGPCRNCSCRLGRGGGHLECTELQCPRCRNPVPIPGDACCPSCRDSELYLFEGQTEAAYNKAINQADFSNSNHLVLYAVFLTAGVFFIALCLLAMLFALKLINEKANKKRNRGVQLKAGRQKSGSTLNTARPLVVKQRIASECESDIANVSLLSSNSETSTPSTSLTGCSANSTSYKMGYPKKV